MNEKTGLHEWDGDFHRWRYITTTTTTTTTTYKCKTEYEQVATYILSNWQQVHKSISRFVIP